MQISSNKIPINTNKAYALKNNPANISFNGYIPVDDSQIASIDKVSLCRPLNQTSFLFRPGLIESLNRIMKAFPSKLNPKQNPPEKPIKFYIYGCSDGHDTYSVIMYLIKKYGSLEEAKKRVEIHSIDIPSPALEMTKNKELKLYCEDYKNLDDYNKRFYEQFLESISANKINDTDYKIKIRDDVFEYSNFKEGRILEDFSPVGKFKEKEPVVVFFRNSLPYIKPEIASTFIDNLYAKLPKGSLFCIGDYEYSSEGKEQVKKVNKTFKAMGIFRPCLFRKPSNFINFNWLRILRNAR